MPEPIALHMVIPDLYDTVGPYRSEGEILAGIPTGCLGTALPRVIVERRHQRLQIDEKLATGRLGERADDTNRGQGASSR